MVKSKLIGNRDRFGVEYSIVSTNNYVMGHMKLWIDGRGVGAFEDVNILSVALNQLDIDDFKCIDGCNFNKYSPSDIYDLISSGVVDDAYRYVLGPGEAFDDFLLYWYSCGNKLNFLWKIKENPFFKYPDCSREVQFASVCCGEFVAVISEFRKVLAREIGN